MNSTHLELKSINDLLGLRFFVPSYQRGYRWSQRQVNELLEDIWEFRKASENSPKESFYCLQPIVVSSRDDEWELVDGQQRLTTIYLILEYLKEGLAFLNKEIFSLDYETRPSSWDFLQNIDLTRKDENIDFYYICQAFETIDNWFLSRDGSAKINFLTTLLNDEESGKNVKIIWYELAQNENQSVDPIDVFTRINIGKIPLTNSELVKALFLRNIKSDLNNVLRENLKKIQIATEWDRIEYALQNDSFWYFIYGGTGAYDTRIEYIFDLMMEKPKDSEDYFTFHKFYERFETSDSDEIWLSIKRFFQTFDEWYNNRVLYHQIGYLITAGLDILELKRRSENKKKSEFRNHLSEKIRKTVCFDIETLEYGDKRIKLLLLLFNIQTMLLNEKARSRFPFDSYKKENWDIEHIRSIKSDKPTGNAQKIWLETVLEYYIGSKSSEDTSEDLDNDNEKERELITQIQEVLKQTKIPEEDFTELYDKILEYFKENEEPENINSLSNLTLLDSGTNRSYKNSPFPVKRRIIIEKERSDTFIPVCTRNVFLKRYSTRFKQAMFWQPNDADDYLRSIKTVLSEIGRE